MPHPQSNTKMTITRLTLTLLLALSPLTLQAQIPAGATSSVDPAPTPNPDATLRDQANVALAKPDYPAALTLLTTLVDHNPNDPHLLYDLAFAHDALDHTAEAEQTYRRAIAADPTLLEPHLGLGLLLARTGHTTEAHTELSAASAAQTDNPLLKARAYRALARLDFKSHPEAARDELLLALKLSPETHEDTLLAADIADQSNDPAEAEKAYRRVLADTPNDPAATASLAHLIAHDNPVEAQQILTSALAAHPTDPEAPTLTAQLATLYATQGDFAHAIPLTEALHTAHPDDPNIARLLARLYAQSGDLDKAEATYATLRLAHPDPTLLDDRAAILIQLGRFAQAETLLKQAIVDPAAFPTRDDYAYAASHLAFAASNNNDPETTLRALSLRATVLPQSPSSLFLAATAHDKLHEVKLATDLYNQFLTAANGKFPQEEAETRKRLVALAHTHTQR